MERFKKLSMNIRNLNPDVAMHHLVTALRSGLFADSLCKKLAKNLDERRQHATNIMQLEGLCDYRNNV